jgi:hypothetical protein
VNAAVRALLLAFGLAAGACAIGGPAAGPAEGEGDAAEGEGEGEGERADWSTCSNAFGGALAEGPGRLDGTLFSFVPPNQNGCRSDDNHAHLQIDANGAVYDVAINLASDLTGGDERVAFATSTADGALGVAWSEGWHANQSVDYVIDLGLHDEDFTPLGLDALSNAIDDALAPQHRGSVYMFAYGPDGGHKVHRNSSGTDGLVVVDPDRAHPRVLAFRFMDQFF